MATDDTYLQRKARAHRDEDLREEGREEERLDIFREIAALDPFSASGSAGRCNFCDAHDHKPDCLWVRALALKETTPDGE